MESIEELIRFYEDECPEELRLHPESFQHLELEVAQKYLAEYLPAPLRVLDSCSGTGIYAFWLASLGHKVVAGDIVPCNVEKLKDNTAASSLEMIYQGDAADLSCFPDESFDAVLCMGALYHMKAEADRRAALAESHRVLRPGGLLFSTYMNRYGVILNNLDPDMDKLDYILNFAKTGDEGVFYASTADETEGHVRDAGFKIVKHLALDGPALLLKDTAKLLNRNGFERWKEYHFMVCEEPSLLGISYHNMIIGTRI